MKKLLILLVTLALVTASYAGRRWIPRISSSVASCTISANWGTASCSSATSCAAGSTGTHTLTVPAGNSGTLNFSTDDSGASVHTALQYSKNGGAFTTVSEGGTVVFANNDTIDLRITNIIAGPNTVTATVKDNTNGTTLGTFAGTNSHI